MHLDLSEMERDKIRRTLEWVLTATQSDPADRAILEKVIAHLSKPRPIRPKDVT